MTSTDLTTHAFAGDSQRTLVDDDGTVWFVATDVARYLGYRMASDMLRALDEDERGTRPVRTPGGMQDLIVITEPGLYQAITQRQTGRMTDRSLAIQVRAYQRWVTHEVLPSIHHTGSYGATVPDIATPAGVLAMATMFAATAQRLVESEARVAELEPPAAAWTALADASGDYSLRDAAQMLDRDPSITTGQNRLAHYLREVGWIDKRGIPYQSRVDQGLIRSRVRTYPHPRTGEQMVGEPQVRITTKGLGRLHTLLGGSEPLNTERHLVAVDGGAA